MQGAKRGTGEAVLFGGSMPYVHWGGKAKSAFSKSFCEQQIKGSLLTHETSWIGFKRHEGQLTFPL